MADNASGTAGQAVQTAPTDNSPTLAAVVGEMFGDYSDVEPDDAPETPSGSPTETAEAPPAEPEGAPSPEPSAAPADPPAEQTPDAAARTEPEPDPLDGSSPLAYVVNGESRTSDGITLLKDGGAIVDPEKVGWLQQRLSERDHLYERNQELTRLSAWSYTGQDGKQITLVGPDAIRHRDAMLATAGATIKASENLSERLVTQLAAYDPKAFVTVDEAGNVVWNQAALKAVREMVDKDVGRERDLLNREYQLNTSARYTQAPAPQASVPMTPEQITAAAPATVDAVLSALRITNLTAEDKADLAATITDYVRPATAADVQRDPSLVLGQPFVDPRFVTFPKRLSEARGSAAQVASTAKVVDAKNAARLAAAAQGKRPVNAPKIPPTRETVPTSQDNFNEAWDARERAAAGALKAHAFGGR